MAGEEIKPRPRRQPWYHGYPRKLPQDSKGSIHEVVAEYMLEASFLAGNLNPRHATHRPDAPSQPAVDLTRPASVSQMEQVSISCLKFHNFATLGSNQTCEAEWLLR